MKKFYYLLAGGLVVLSMLAVTKYIKQDKKQFSSNDFTPEEFWQNQFQKKRQKEK